MSEPSFTVSYSRAGWSRAYYLGTHALDDAMTLAQHELELGATRVEVERAGLSAVQKEDA